MEEFFLQRHQKALYGLFRELSCSMRDPTAIQYRTPHIPAVWPRHIQSKSNESPLYQSENDTHNSNVMFVTSGLILLYLKKENRSE